MNQITQLLLESTVDGQLEPTNKYLQLNLAWVRLLVHRMLRITKNQ